MAVDPSVNRPVDIPQSVQPPPPTSSSEGVKAPPQAPPGSENIFAQFSDGIENLPEAFKQAAGELLKEINEAAQDIKFSNQEINAESNLQTANQQVDRFEAAQAATSSEEKVKTGEQQKQSSNEKEKSKNFSEADQKRQGLEAKHQGLQKTLAGDSKGQLANRDKTSNDGANQKFVGDQAENQPAFRTRGLQNQTGRSEQKSSSEAAARQPQLKPAEAKQVEQLQRLRLQLAQARSEEAGAKTNAEKQHAQQARAQVEAKTKGVEEALKTAGVSVDPNGKVVKKEIKESLKEKEELAKLKETGETEGTTQGDSSAKGANRITARVTTPVGALKEGIERHSVSISGGNEKTDKEFKATLGFKALGKGIAQLFASLNTATTNAVQLDQQGDGGQRGLGRRGKNEQEPVEFGGLASQAKLDGWGQVQTSGAPVTVAILGPDRKIRNLYQRDNVPPEVAEAMKGLAGVRQYIQAKRMQFVSEGSSGMMA